MALWRKVFFAVGVREVSSWAPGWASEKVARPSRASFQRFRCIVMVLTMDVRTIDGRTTDGLPTTGCHSSFILRPPLCKVRTTSTNRVPALHHHNSSAVGHAVARGC